MGSDKSDREPLKSDGNFIDNDEMLCNELY